VNDFQHNHLVSQYPAACNPAAVPICYEFVLEGYNPISNQGNTAFAKLQIPLQLQELLFLWQYQ